MRKIVRNAIRCNHCGDVIESAYRYEYVQCSYGKVAVDGGHDYLRRSFSRSRDDYTDLSESVFCVSKGSDYLVNWFDKAC